MSLSIQERLKDLRVERGLTPVSYTHLDVYKRQARQRVSDEFGALCFFSSKYCIA